MENKEKTVMSGEIFVKCEPQDNRKEKEALRKYYKELEEHHIKVITPTGENPVDKMPDFDYTGMDKLWLLTVQEGNYFFLSLENNPKIPSSIAMYTSLENALKEFRTLRNIIETEKFVGKKVKTKNIDGRVYSLYELPNVVITCIFNEDNSLKWITPVINDKKFPIPYEEGAPVLKMKNPHDLINTIYRRLN